MTQRIKPIALFTDTDAKAMGVYLALLYLRFDKTFTNYSQKPTAYEMVQEYTFKYMWFNKYFERRAADGREAINAAIAFIDKLFEHEEMLSFNNRNKGLDDLEAKFIENFTKAFKKYLRLDVIPKELVEVLRIVLLDIRSRLYGGSTTPAGTTTLIDVPFVENLKIYHGIKEEEAWKLSSYLDSSGLMLELYIRAGTRSGNFYSIFVFPAPCLTDEVISFLKPTKPLLLPPPPPAPEVVRTSRPTKEILERIVGSVLEDLGFKVYTNVKRAARTGGPIEVDVWAEKDVGPMRFSVYVSCKNWDREIDRSVIDEEFGRTLNLRDQPQLKVIVAKRLTEPAKEVAISDGFLVIELGRKAEAKTAAEAYELVYETLNRLFMATAPPRLLEIASRVGEIAEELGRIKDELTELMKRPGVK